MKFIDTIEIKNFKSIRHQKIEGCKRVNVFIGYPNVGKSNILEALSLLSYINKENKQSLKNIARFKELIDLFSDGDKRGDIEIFTSEYVIALRYINKTSIELGIVSSDNYVERFNESTSQLLRSITFGIEGHPQRNSNRDYYEKVKVKKYQFTSDIQNKIDIDNDLKVLSYPFGRNLSEVIRYSPSLRKECGELFSLYNLKLIFDENENIVIQKQLDQFTAFQFSFTQVADTLQRLVFHKAAIETNEGSVLLFEEPEAHMFPPYISKFTSDIVNEVNGNQFFLTTHSPFVLNDLMDNLSGDELAVFIVRYKNETGETLIYRMTSEEVQEAYQFGYDFFMNMEKFITEKQHE